MENLNQIKSGFIDYLKNIYKDTETQEKIDSYGPDLSIFIYSNAFQNYLKTNGYDEETIFSQSIDDMKDVLVTDEFQSSQASDSETEINGDNLILSSLSNVFSQDEDLFNAVNSNSDEIIDIDEMNEFLSSVDEMMKTEPDEFETTFDGLAKTIQDIKGDDGDSVEGLLESIYNSEEAVEYLDVDGDGEISDFEKELFESFVQGDKDELTPEDLQKAFEEIQNGTFKYDVKLPEDAVSVEDIEGTSASEGTPSGDNIAARQTSNPSQNLSSTGRTSGGAPVSGTSSQNTPSNINDMNLSQLKTEQTKRQSNVDNAKNDVDSTVAEIDDVKNNEYTEAKNAYDEAVEKDENLDDELKQKRTDNLEAIETKTGEITDLNSQIAQTEVDLGKANNKLDSDKKNLSSLKSALSSLDSAEDQDAVAQQRAALQQQINTLEQTAIPADEKECERLDQLLNGGGDSEGLKSQLETKEKELEDLEKTKDEIESEIAEKGNEETKKALENFQAVEKKLEELTNKLPELQKTLSTAQTELTEVNELIATKEAEETEQENSYYNGDLPSELVSALDTKLGKGFCAKLEEVAKKINCNPVDLIGMMQSESGINPKAYNKNGGATGLIQFMPSTAKSLGTTTEELMNMSAIDQLDYVEKYFTNWTGGSGQHLEAGDLYTLCFLPAFLDREVLCSSSDSSTSKYYKPNSGLDLNKDGQITKSELAQRVHNKYQEVLKQYGLA